MMITDVSHNVKETVAAPIWKRWIETATQFCVEQNFHHSVTYYMIGQEMFVVLLNPDSISVKKL